MQRIYWLSARQHSSFLNLNDLYVAGLKTLFIINSTKSRARKVAEQLAAVASEFDAELVYTDVAGHATEIAWKRGGEFELLVAVGGDGTINEVVNGIMQLESRPALSVIPFGTGNDFVRTAIDYDDLDSFKKAWQNKSLKAIDVGQLEHEGTTEYFANIADAGIGPYVVNLLDRTPSWMSGKLGYSKAILTALIRYKPIPLQLTSADFDWQGDAYAIILANGKYFGGGLGIAPDAELDSGQFQGIVIGDISSLDYIKQLGRLKRAELLDHPKVTYFTATEVELSGPGKMEKDGEMGLALPVKISCVPKQLKLLVSSD